MPDHVHVLVEGLDRTADLTSFVTMSKQRSGYLHRRYCGQRLWQEGHHERVLRGDDDTKRLARYLLENPVRAGLVRDPRQYPHSGSAIWTLDELLRSV